MILKRISLNDFLSHNNTTVEFPLGVTVFMGPNGAGKTSIIDGIFVALFNHRPRGENWNDVIRRGRDRARIELEFEEGGVPYRIFWERKKDGAPVYKLYRADEGILIAEGVYEVQTQLKAITGLDRDSAINSILIRQGEITSLLDQAPAKRKEVIGRLLGLEKLEKAWQFMREVIYYFEQVKNELEKEIAEIEGKLKSKYEQRDKLKQEIQELNRQIKELKQKLKSLSQQLSAIERELNELNAKEKRYNELMLELTKIIESIRLVQEQIKKLEEDLNESKKAKEKLKELEGEIRKIPLLEEYIKQFNKFKELNTKKEQLEKDLNKISAIREEANKAMKSCKVYVEYIEVGEEFIEVPTDLSEIEKSTTTISTLVRSTVAQIKKDTEELEKLISEALKFLPEPTIEAKEKKLKELKEEEKRLENIVSGLRKELGEVSGRINDLRKALDMLGESEACPVCKTKLTPEHRDRVKHEMEEEIKSLEEIVKQIRREIEEAENQKRTIKEEIERVSKINVERIEQLQKEIEEMKEKLAKHYTELEGIITELNNLENDIRPKISEIESEIKEIEERLNELIEEIGEKPEDPENELKELRKKKEEYDRLKPIADRYEKLLEDIKEAQEKLRKLENKKHELQEEIKKLGYDKQHHEKVRKEHEELLRKFESTKTELEEKTKSLEKNLKDLTEVEAEIKELEEKRNNLKAELDKIKKLLNDLERIRRAYHRDGVQRLLRQKIAPIISELATGYIENFNMDITDIYLSEDFDITVVKNSVEVPISTLSGGEKVAVALALRLAIARALSKSLSIVIMDEPTTHLDEERRKDLVEILDRFFKSEGAIPQVVIVTHHPELETVADTLYLIRNVAGVSQVQEVESLESRL
ncbi:AAA family ATPase [Thermococcus sibiricus]|uniref:AAA family ATPase n=1 Tax=Thermococcus sibiricus TaxID=172049 RepID=UPI0009D72E7A|nr:AAA family ATPase [Thermococcus sibiricus]